ncbi:MAG: dihydropteroate synthase, partial [Cutibacterium granulosum]|nr:dihydropteroate synthase [Cutibacterium granulosum]
MLTIDPTATNPHPARTLVMGVVNVTPDSFSDGGLWADPKVAIRHSWDLLAQGADILDIGGESTRPGTERTSEADEIARVVPVVKALANRDGAPREGLQGTDPHVASEWDPDRPLSISVDTMRSRVAQEAIDAGATIINDVSGGLADPRILDVVASTGVDYVLMHWRGQSVTMQSHVHYDDPV